MSTLELPVANHFPPGTDVEAHPRISDFFSPGQTKPSAKGKVGKDGTLKLTGLVEHGPYFLAAEVTEEVPDAFAKEGKREVTRWRSIAVTASNPEPARNRDETNAQAAREAEATAKVAEQTAVDTAAAPAGGTTAQEMPSVHITEGARSTANILPSRIEGVKKGTQLASHTVTGEAVVVESDDEEKPKPAKKKATARKAPAKKAAKKR